MQEILISHLDQQVIAGPIGAKGAPGRWRTVHYQTDRFDGVLLGCGQATRPEPVTLRLGVRGPHRIRLIPCFYTWTLYHDDIEAFRRLVRSVLERGADGYCIWDGGYSEGTAKIGDIGHKNWAEPEYRPESPSQARIVSVLSLDGFRIDRYGLCEIV